MIRIGLSRKRPEGDPGASPALKPEGPARANEWTHGSALGTKLVSAAVIGVLLTGPAALVLELRSGARAAGPVTSASAQPDSERAGVGAFAAQFVIAWLKSSKADAHALDAFGQFPPGSTGDQPAQATDAVVAAADPGDVPGVWSVTVSVRVLEAQSEKGQPVQRWALRWFRVPVASSNGAMVAGTLPAEIPAPGTLARFPGLAYRENLPLTGGAAATVSAFLTALLTGQGGDLSRYLSPNADPGIKALVPAPYAALTVASVTSTEPAPDTPDDGSRVEVIASVNLIDAAGSQRLSDVPLVLAARAGRWEVVSMPPLPVVAPNPTPTPTSTPTN